MYPVIEYLAINVLKASFILFLFPNIKQQAPSLYWTSLYLFSSEKKKTFSNFPMVTLFSPRA